MVTDTKTEKSQTLEFFDMDFEIVIIKMLQ